MKVVKGFWHILLRTVQLLGVGLVALVKLAIKLINTPKALDPPQVKDENLNNLSELSQSEETIEDQSLPVPLQPQAHWHGTGHTANVQGISLKNPMLYMGQSLGRADDPTQLEPCLVQPDLAVQAAIGPSFFPRILSYAALSAEQRYIFLDWIASERQNPDIDTTYIYLFLFGLERRILVDLKKQENSLEELLALTLELEQLQSLYGFRDEDLASVLQALIERCQVQLALVCQPETLLALLPQNDQLSMALKVAIGRCIETQIQTQKPIPMPLLWAWYQRSALATALRTPAKRCAHEFESFLNLHGGVSVQFNVEETTSLPKLRVEYQPQSPTFGSQAAITLVETVNIEALTDSLQQLQPLIDDCTIQLDAYSRLLGRSPELQGTPTAVALLPAELVLAFGNDTVTQLHNWLSQTLGDRDWTQASGEELFTHWPTTNTGKLRKKEAELLAQLLEKLGFAMEPDVRFGSKPLTAKQNWILFRSTSTADASTYYKTAMIWLEVLSMLEKDSLETGISFAIQDAWPHISAQLSQHFEVDSHEAKRLQAYARWCVLNAITWRQICNRVKKLSQPEKIQFKLGLDGLNQYLEPQETLFQAQFAELIHLLTTAKPSAILENEQPAHTTANNGTTEEPTLESVEPSGVRINEKQEEEFALDFDLIKQRQTDSQQASWMLSEIFEEAPAASEPALILSPEPQVMASDLGLDAIHLKLLQRLGQREVWGRDELEPFATEQGLMLDGALENINDVAFDQCDEALTEGDDPIEVNIDVFQELWAA